MKLNKELWIKEVRAVEAEIRDLKKQMHQPDYWRTFNYFKLFHAKAKATRLYALRRELKGKEIETKGGWYYAQSSYNGSVHLNYVEILLKSKGPSALHKEIVYGVKGWAEQFIVQEPHESLTTEVTAQVG